MNGIERITQRILDEARAERAEIKNAQDAECSRILSEGRKKADEVYERVISQGNKDIESAVSRIDRTAKLEVRKALLEEKQKQIDVAFEAAKKKLGALPEGEYVEFFAEMAAKAAETGSEQLIFNKSDREKRGSKIVELANKKLSASGKNGKLTLSDMTEDMSGGVVLKNGNISTNCSVDTLVSVLRDRLATEVAGILFEE